ncbi:hypothetical protein L484_025627 [Morus notabilis]|uniref:Uncharacterized protein n=1 Tax=Morus notabilis TaxID=981085 RepID=W9R8W7_9ROSA|nr:hypothetical protein L484_025627 [Morus notabilis]
MFPAVDKLIYSESLSKKREDGGNHEDGNDGISRRYAPTQVMENIYGASDRDYNYLPNATMDGDDDDDDDDSSYDYAPAA